MCVPWHTCGGQRTTCVSRESISCRQAWQHVPASTEPFHRPCLLFWVRVTGSPGRPQTHYVAEDDIELRILLPQPPESWNCRCEPPRAGSIIFLNTGERSLWNISGIKILLKYQILVTIDFNQVCVFLIQNYIQLPLVRLLPNNPVIAHGFHNDFFIFICSVRKFQMGSFYTPSSTVGRKRTQDRKWH